MRVALLANPESGGGEGTQVDRLLAGRGVDVQVFDLDSCDAAIETAPDRIAVAGGDGSIACAAEAAGRAGVPLAVIPVGTANDFARAVGIPQEPEPAIELAVDGSRIRRLDLGIAESGASTAARLGYASHERPFVNAVSAGLSPDAARNAHGLKRLLGPLAYAVGALRAGLTTAPIRCEVRCDGETLFSGRAWQVTVGLTGAFGGGAEVEADPRDGLLDVVVIEAGSRLRLIAHAYGMRLGSIEEQQGVVTGSGREVEVVTAGGTGFNVDGELVEAERLRLSLRPRAYDVVVG